MAWPRWPRHRKTSRCRGFFVPVSLRQAVSCIAGCSAGRKCMPIADCRMPDAAIQRFSDSAIQRFSDSAIQRFSDSAIQRFSDSAMSRCPDVPMSRCPDVPMSRCPDVPMSRCPNAPTPRRPDAPTPRRPDAPTPRRPDASTSFAPRVFSQGRVSTHCPCGVRFSDHPVLQHADINHVVALINETSKRHC